MVTVVLMYFPEHCSDTVNFNAIHWNLHLNNQVNPHVLLCRSNLRDSSRLETLIKMGAAELAASLPQSGHSYAMTHSASSLNPAAHAREVFSGVTQVRHVDRCYKCIYICYIMTIDTVSWLGGVVVTHPLWVQEVPGSIPGSGKGFYVSFFFELLLLCFYFFVKNTLFVTKVCNFFYNVNLFTLLNILQDLWPIIRV